MSKTVKSALAIVLILGILVVSGVLMSKATKSLEHEAYPRTYREIIETKADEYQVPISVIYAVIFQESRFDPNAESVDGARGLMQIVEITHEWIDYYQGESKGSWDDLYDPEINLDYGIWLLGYCYREFGNWETVYAAYNAGINRVKNWLLDPTYSEDGVTLKEIPFEETRKYVEKVSLYRKCYQTVYDID